MKSNIENVEESNPRLAQILTTIPWYILSSGVLDTPLSKTSVIHSPMLSDIDFSLVVLRWPVTLHRYSPVSSAFTSGITSLRLQSSCLEFSGRCLPSARYQLYVASSPGGALINDAQHHKFRSMVLAIRHQCTRQWCSDKWFTTSQVPLYGTDFLVEFQICDFSSPKLVPSP